MKRSHTALLAAGLLLIGTTSAQEPLDNYYPYEQPDYEEESRPMLRPDSTLFYRGVALAEDLYGLNTDFRLSFVRYRRRGLAWDTERNTLHGIELDYDALSALRNLGAEELRTGGLHMSATVGDAVNGSREMRLPEEESAPWHRASVTFTGRNYLFGAKIAAGRQLGHGWSGAAALHYRTGRDLRAEGVFNDGLSIGVRTAKRFGEEHSLTLLLVAAPSMRGLRSPSTEEAFTLTGDPLYNPAWGFQDGKVRNSHVRRQFEPFAAAIYRRRLSGATRLEATLGLRYGWQSYSSLGWYNARTPLPDNYRYLPSYTGDRATKEAWRRNETRYTQIDWDGLIARNRLADGEAVYALEERMTRTARMQLELRLTTEVDSRLTLRYGLSADIDNRRNYKRMRDLLGARYLTDIDQYLVDDDTYSNLLQNDLRHPDRRIGEGDRFGYDYALQAQRIRAHIDAEYRTDRLTARLHASLGYDLHFRQGYYEKELFAGSGSYGRSRECSFTPYLLKGAAGWAFSPRSYLELVLATGARSPQSEALFLQPQYNNRLVDNPSTEQFHAIELNYRRTGRYLSLQASLYAVAMFDGLKTRRYYDDLAATYCDLVVSGIGTLSAGAEAALEWRMSRRWSLSLAAAAARYKYIRNPRVTLYSDVDNRLVDDHAESHMGGCVPGGAPQLSGCLQVRYFGPRGWGFRLSGSYIGARYVEPSEVRRTERVARQGALSEELYERFTTQERLGDVCSLDASLFKSFYFTRSRLSISLMLNNLLGGRNAVYSAYESLRVRRSYSGDTEVFTPFDTRLLHIYPRTFYLTVSYKF